MNGLAICSGVGGLELGIELALGEQFRCICHVERDAYASATLVARMADKALAPAPIWDDIFTFDPRPWRGNVDIVTAGFPCQPFSVAGKQRAEEDERHLFPRIAEIICDVGPRLVFLENVRGLLTASGGRVFGDVLGTMADLGFDSEWLCLRASAVGAPHRRERVFILGVSNTFRDQLRIEPGWIWGANREGEALAGDAGEDMAHATGDGTGGTAPVREGSQRRKGWGARPDKRDGELAHAQRARWQGECPGPAFDAGSKSESGSGELAPFPPGPEDRDAWARVLAERPDLAPALADAERGPGKQLGAPRRTRGIGQPVPRHRDGQSEAKPELCRLDDGVAGWLDYRQDRLRCAGNGVVALQAAAAFSVLARRAGVMGSG